MGRAWSSKDTPSPNKAAVSDYSVARQMLSWSSRRFTCRDTYPHTFFCRSLVKRVGEKISRNRVHKSRKHKRSSSNVSSWRSSCCVRIRFAEFNKREQIVREISCGRSLVDEHKMHSSAEKSCSSTWPKCMFAFPSAIGFQGSHNISSVFLRQLRGYLGFQNFKFAFSLRNWLLYCWFPPNSRAFYRANASVFF